MELNYSPRDIKEIEDVSKKPLTDTIADFSMKTIELFVRKGLKVDEEGAFNEIQKYLDEGNDLIALYILIMEKLQSRGFLPKALKIEELKKKMENLEV